MGGVTNNPLTDEYVDPFRLQQMRRNGQIADLSPGMGGFRPDSGDQYSSFWRSPYQDEMLTPSLAASGSSGQSATAQPQADLSSRGPSAGAGAVLQARSAPPPVPTNTAAAPAPAPAPAVAPPPVRRPPPGMSSAAPAPPDSATAAPAAQDKAPGPVDLSPQIQDAAARIAQGPPQQKTSGVQSVLQRLGLAVLSATKLAPYAQQIIHPIWSNQMAGYQQAEKDLTSLSTAQEQQARGQWYAAQAGENKGRYLRVGTGVFDQQTGKWVTMPTDKSNLVPVDPAVARARGLAPMDDGKFWVPSAVAAQFVKPSKDENYLEVTPIEGSRLGIVPDENGKFYVPKEGIGSYISGKEKPPAPPNAEAQKVAYQTALSKMAASGELPPDYTTNQGHLITAIKKSGALSPQEKNDAQGYIGANATPTSAATNMNIRVAGMMESRPISVIDSQNGQALTLNMEAFNQLQHTNPGRYVQSSVAVPAMGKEANFEDIQYNIDNARSAIKALGTVDAGTRAQLANMMSDEHADTVVGNVNRWLRGETATTMTPEQRNAVIAMRNLMENSLMLRNIAGMGQGSDQMRQAILSTLPNSKSPDVPYMLDQIKQFEGIVQRLHHGVPSIGQPGQGRGGAAGRKSDPLGVR